MRNTHLLLLFLALVFAAGASAQFRKIDTVAKMGDVGFKVSCSNKKIDNNPITISPVGFKGSARPGYFNLKGVVTKIAVDDFNDDGFPDLVVFVYSGDSTEKGNVIAICSKDNTEIIPAYFADIYNDPKLRIGYKGHDVFTDFAGTLLRTFPIYKPEDTDTPTGGKRVVQYKIMPGEGGSLTFKVLRTYEKPE